MTCVTCIFDTFDMLVEARMTEEEWMVKVKVLPVQWNTNRNDRSVSRLMHARASVLTVLKARKCIGFDWSKSSCNAPLCGRLFSYIPSLTDDASIRLFVSVDGVHRNVIRHLHIFSVLQTIRL